MRICGKQQRYALTTEYENLHLSPLSNVCHVHVTKLFKQILSNFSSQLDGVQPEPPIVSSQSQEDETLACVEESQVDS